MKVDELNNTPDLQKILWACYECWQRDESSPHKREICYHWVIGDYKNKFGATFHQSQLGRLAKLGFLEKSDIVRGGQRRYYKIIEPDRVAALLKEWNLIS